MALLKATLAVIVLAVVLCEVSSEICPKTRTRKFFPHCPASSVYPIDYTKCCHINGLPSCCKSDSQTCDADFGFPSCPRPLESRDKIFCCKKYIRGKHVPSCCDIKDKLATWVIITIAVAGFLFLLGVVLCVCCCCSCCWLAQSRSGYTVIRA